MMPFEVENEAYLHYYYLSLILVLQEKCKCSPASPQKGLILTERVRQDFKNRQPLSQALKDEENVGR